MSRRYDTSSARFSQPDPYGGSYDFSDPQSLNCYAYTKNDPVNFRDPSGLEPNTCMLDGMPINCGTAGLFLGSGAGVLGPLNTAKYDPEKETFVYYTAIAASGGTASGWIPHGYHYLGELTWGFTNFSQVNADGAPMSYSASLRYADLMNWTWRNSELATALNGSWFNAYGDKVGYLTQSVENDMNAQLLMAAPFAGLVESAAAGAADAATQVTIHGAKQLGTRGDYLLAGTRKLR